MMAQPKKVCEVKPYHKRWQSFVRFYDNEWPVSQTDFSTMKRKHVKMILLTDKKTNERGFLGQILFGL